MYDAAVVGAGPNGLAAALALARAGRSVVVYETSATPGGAARTAEVTLAGFRHDLGAAVHPLGAASPFFNSLPLHDHGLTWLRPDIPLAHPLDGGRAVAVHHSLEVTGEELGTDGVAYRHLVGRLALGWDSLDDTLLGAGLRLPRHPVAAARFGRHGLPSVTRLAGRNFVTTEARALLAGLAAHAPMPLDRATTAAVALTLAALVHVTGWPVAAGGSQAIVDALVSLLRAYGVVIETNHPVGSLDDIPAVGAILFDTTPGAVAAIAGARLPALTRRSYRRFPHAPGVFKVDYALDGPIPWTADACRRAGTLHLGGSEEEIARAEREVRDGRAPERPFVIASQPTVLDPGRAPAGKHVLWAYCHVPNGSHTDMTEAIEQQLERFAPGFRDLILAKRTMGPADLQRDNANLVGGDIAGGSTERLRIIFRPGRTLHPYRAAPGLYLCSASTPPGPGVHGMCGFHAAQAVLRGT